MNYGKHETEKKIKSVNSKAKKYTSRVFLAFLKSLFVLCLFCLVVAGSIGFGMVKGKLEAAVPPCRRHVKESLQQSRRDEENRNEEKKNKTGKSALLCILDSNGYIFRLSAHLCFFWIF